MSWTNFGLTKRVVLATIALLSLGMSCPLWAQKEISLYSLGNANLSPIYGGLAADSSGALYGNTWAGGAANAGAVFQLVPPATKGGGWTLNTLYSFPSTGSDARVAGGTPAVDSHGNVYGTTVIGGAYGSGAIYEVSPPATLGGAWTETVIASVSGGNFQAGVTLDSAGNLYTATANGAILQLVPEGSGGWTLNTLYQLPGRSVMPRNLTLDKVGNIYGLAETGGLYGYGYAFEIQPPFVSTGQWRESDLYDFTGGADGGTPLSNLTLAAGVLYGTASVGGAAGFGNVFSLTPPATRGLQWTEATLYSFQGGADGSTPEGGVAVGSGGTLWGATSGYDSDQYPGTAYKLTPPTESGGAWTETVIYNFHGLVDGGTPLNSLLPLHGSFFGTTYNSSVVYEVLPK
jgi:uncharacterized repeat protein (TIGR03803 family)